MVEQVDQLVGFHLSLAELEIHELAVLLTVAFHSSWLAHDL